MNLFPLVLPHIPLPLQNPRAFLPLLKKLICFPFTNSEHKQIYRKSGMAHNRVKRAFSFFAKSLGLFV